MSESGYTLEGAEKLAKALAGFEGGTLVVNVVEMQLAGGGQIFFT